MAAVAFESYAVTTAMPYVAADLGHVEWYAWGASAFMMTMVVSIVVGGRLADARGPAIPLTIGMIVFISGLSLAGASPHMLVLLIARVVQGLGGGLLSVALWTLIAVVWDEAERPRVLVWTSAAWVLPALVGPPIAGWVAGHFSWHWVFWGLVPLLVIGSIVCFRPVMSVPRPTEPPRQRPLPIWAGIGIAVALAGLQFAGQDLRWWSVLPALLGVVLLVICFPPLMPQGFTRLGRGLAAAVLVRMLVPGTFYAGEYFMPLMLKETHGVSPQVAGVVISVGALGWFIGSWIQSRSWAPDRLTLITGGAIATAAGLLVVAIVSASDVWFGVAAIGWISAGLGMGLLITGTTVKVMGFSAADEYGRNSTSMQVAEHSGATLVTAASGTLFAALHSQVAPQSTYWPLLVMLAIIALAGAAVSRRIRV